MIYTFNNINEKDFDNLTLQINSLILSARFEGLKWEESSRNLFLYFENNLSDSEMEEIQNILNQ